MHHFLRRAAAAIVLVMASWAPLSRAADWPMWRCNAQRSGASPEKLPDKLRLRWSLTLPPPKPAWPNEPRIHFDAAYEPVVAGGLVFLASPNDGSVRAYDARTGALRWTTYTDGPARVAPVVWKGRVFVGSDDGFLYALDAATGKRLWRVNASGLPVRRHLGANRLVSFRVVRGGPVLADGVLYVGAGVWPTLGVCVLALDPATGKTLWRNDDVFWLPHIRIDHNMHKDAALAPEGYLAVVGDKLVVPNGRSMPARFDRKTGKMLYFVQGYRRGHWRVAAMGRYAFVGPSAVVDLETGREVGSKWAEAGKDAPKQFDARKFDLFEGPMFGYNFMPAVTAWSVLTPTRVYGLYRGVVHAYDLTRPKVSDYERRHGPRVLKPRRWDLPLLWKVRAAKGARDERTLIKAGDRLYGASGGKVFAVQAPASSGDKPRVVWSAPLPGKAMSMAAAEGRLFVSLADGRLLCYAAGEGRAISHPLIKADLPSAPAAARAEAEQLAKAAGARAGFVVLLAPRDPEGLTAAFLRAGKFRVVVVVKDPARLRKLRDAFARAGAYGERVEAFAAEDPLRFDLPPYLATLLVVDGADAARAEREAARLYDILHPYGGCLCVRGAAADRLARAARLARKEQAEASRAGEFALVRRPGPLPGAAWWTHECGDAQRSFYSRDDRVRAPLGVLWYGDGPGYGFYKFRDYGAGVKPQVVGGRVIVLRQRRPTTLAALDAYTGRLLWKRGVNRYARYASLPDGVFVADGDMLRVLDPATGKELRHSRIDPGPAPEKPILGRDIRVDGSVVVVAVGFGRIIGGAYTEMQLGGLWDSKVLVAFDRRTGKFLWRRRAEERFNNNAFAMGDGKVFCVDSFSPVEGWKRYGKKGGWPKEVKSTVLALDARTGAVRWRHAETNRYRQYPPGSWLGERANDDWLSYAARAKIVISGRSGDGYALRASDGKRLWRQRVGGQPMIVRDKTFLTQGGDAFDIQTGRRVADACVPIRERHGCNYFVASKHLLMGRETTVSYVDLDSPRLNKYWLRNVRSGCDASVIAADGLLNVPNFASGCVCNYPIQTSFAMVTMPETARWARPKPLLPRPRPRANAR